MPDIMLVVTLLTSGKLMQSERQDLSIYRAMGLPCTALRRSFSLRFFAGFACGLGTALSAVGTDPIVAVLMRMYGISNFSSHTAFSGIVSPWGRDCTAVHRFACLACGKIKRARLTKLIAGAIDSEGCGAHSALPWARKDRRAACMAPA